MEQGNISYLSYNQNVSFVNRTLHQGTAGLINNPNSDHLEGIRVSLGIEGANIITSVYAVDLGWMDPVKDGEYAGTTGQMLPIQTIEIKLPTPEDQ